MEFSDDMVIPEIYFIGQGLCPDNLTLGPGEKRNIILVALPGVSADCSVKYTLAGEGSELLLNGLYLCNGDERLNITVDVEHKVSNCISNQLFKGIVGGNAKAAFFGKIIVAQDAQKTEACQANHNILLSDTARVDTKPQLEIYADDVKCSHGATIGRLNEDELFYMRSRGIPEKEARYLQMISFLYPIIANINDKNCRKRLSKLIESYLRSMA